MKFIIMELDDLFIRGGTPMADIAVSNWRAQRRTLN